MTGRFRHVLGACALFAALATSLFAVSAASAADQPITIEGFKFPATINVKAGDSVTWTNNDRAPHTVTADNGSFDKQVAASGGSATVTFSTAGTFAYHCTIHPNMTGTVVVAAAVGGTGSTTSSAPAAATVAVPATGSGVESGSGSGAGWLTIAGGGLAALGIAVAGLGLRKRSRA